MKSCCVLQDHYDDQRHKIVFHKTPDLQHQDQDHMQCTRPRPIFWSQTGLVLRPTVSDHITGSVLTWSVLPEINKLIDW